MKKIIQFLLPVLLAFVSCTSTNDLLVFSRSDGSYMYHSICGRTKGKDVEFLSADLTVNEKDGCLSDDMTVDYTLVCNGKAENALTGFIANGKKNELENQQILTKEIYKKSKLSVRITSSLEKKSAEELIHSGARISFFVKTDDFYEELNLPNMENSFEQLRIMF